jgi:hypothetical protein
MLGFRVLRTGFMLGAKNTTEFEVEPFPPLIVVIDNYSGL